MPKMMQNRMCAPGKSRRGIGGVLRELFTYSNKLKAPSVAAFCFAVAGAVLTIIGPSLLSRITDLISDALDGEIDLAAIGRTGVILLVIYGFSAVFTYVEHFIMATVTLELSRDMRQDLSRKINRVPMSYFSKVSYGDILSRHHQRRKYSAAGPGQQPALHDQRSGPIPRLSGDDVWH